MNFVVVVGYLFQPATILQSETDQLQLVLASSLIVEQSVSCAMFRGISNPIITPSQLHQTPSVPLLTYETSLFIATLPPSSMSWCMHTQQGHVLLLTTLCTALEDPIRHYQEMLMS